MAQPFLADFPPSLGNSVQAGQHYMLINSYESVNAITTGEKLLSSIGLYIPAGSLTTSYTGNYEGKDGAATAAEKSSAIFNSGNKDLMGRVLDFASSVGSSTTQKVLQTADAGGFLSASCKVPNNHMALVYRGPNTFRQHTFAFKFFPLNSDESNIVRGIIAEFKHGTLPRMSAAGAGAGVTDAFFKSPRQHKIKFCKGGSGASSVGDENSYLFEIGTSVITNMQVNYDPQSTVGFHSNGAPVSIDMSLTFQEIDLQISKDAVTTGTRNLADNVRQNQSSSQLTSAEQATGDDENLNSQGFADI
jgi:hypothetical protein